MCSRIARAFLLSSSRQPHNENHNKKSCSDTFDEPDLEFKVNRETPGQLGHYSPNIHVS